MTPVLGAGFLGIEHFTPPWDVFFLPLFNLLVALYGILLSDFALAIIVLTVVVRTILAPLFVRQIRSQREMQRMQPLIREVQRKHKGNRAKISEETMALYKEHGVNPAAGCVPLLLQLPLLYALYSVLNRASGVIQGFTPNADNQAAFDALQSQGLVQAIADSPNHYQIAVNGACNLPQFSQLPQFLPLNCQLIDPIKLDGPIHTTVGWLFGLDLAKIDHVFAIPIAGFALSGLAVVAAILQFVQVRMTSPKPNPDDPTAATSNTMTYLFPFLTVFWGGLFPSGLILYWIVYTAYLVVHQYTIMGWGNLFPLFGWQPRWAPAPVGSVAAPRRRDDEPSNQTDGRDGAARTSPPAAPRPGVAPGIPGQRPQRPGQKKRRGRKR
ncbi:MAG TPA: membrane protein insertase YidC [Candidatus Limnocylindria bacterium]